MKQQLISELFELWQQCKNENWGGNNEKPITKDTFLLTKELIDLLPDTVRKPYFEPDIDGSIHVEFYKSDERGMCLLLNEDRTIFYAGVIDEYLFRGCDYLDKSIPQIILSLICQI